MSQGARVRIWLTIGLVVSLTITLGAQTPSPSGQDDVVRTNTNLIQIRAVVTDRAGKLIDHLNQDDFEVLENGRPQNVSVFSLERIQGKSTISDAAARDQASATNPESPRVAPRPGRTIVLFVDTLHLSTLSLVRARQQLKQFIDEQITDQDLVGVVTTSDSLGVLGQFMRDRKMLKYAIDKIQAFVRPNTLFTPYLAAKVFSENPVMPPPTLPQIGRSRPSPTTPDLGAGGPQALAVASAIIEGEEGVAPSDEMVRARAREILAQESILRRTTLQTLKAVSGRMATVPGQRLIAFVSDGFTTRDLNGGADNGDFNSATSSAVRAGVVIYAFNPLGLTTPVEFTAANPVHLDSGQPLLGAALGSYMADSRTDAQSNLREMAAETGGEAYLNSNDTNGQFKTMLDANQTYYALGYYFHDETDRKFRSIKVRVRNHPEYKVRTQLGYQLSKDTETEIADTPQKRLLQAMLAPIPLTNLSVTSSANFLVRAGDDAKVTLEVHFDGRSIEFEQDDKAFKLNCEVAVAVIDANGKVADGVAESISGAFTPEQIDKAKRDGFRYSKRIALGPGLYQLRVGVRDLHSGLMGTSSSWVSVPDLRSRKLTLSGLFLGKNNRESNGPSTAAESRQPRLLVGPAYFKNGDVIFYRFVLYHAGGGEGKLLKVEVLLANAVVYEGAWQPLNNKVIRSDNVGSEVGGEIRMTAEPGIYTLRATVKDNKSMAQQTVDFELLP